jgi:L-lactate dehydrogenase complex protein LldG
MSSRDDILARVRKNLPQPTPLPTVPHFGTDRGMLLERFSAAVVQMGGKFADAPPDGDLEVLIERLFPAARVICSATPEVRGNLALDAVQRPAELKDVDVGVVRAVYGVAETGSLWLTEAQFRISALGFLAQHLVALLDPAQILENLHHAYRRREEFEARYGVLMTGPSATADIEGVLIHGAQGIRSLTVVLLPVVTATASTAGCR